MAEYLESVLKYLCSGSDIYTLYTGQVYCDETARTLTNFFICPVKDLVYTVKCPFEVYSKGTLFRDITHVKH